MRAIIIEDEKPAAEKLLKAIRQADTEVEVVAVLNSVRSAVEWLEQNPMPGLLFMDIELSDGLSFKIFDFINISSPVIFCTPEQLPKYDSLIQGMFSRMNRPQRRSDSDSTKTDKKN